MRLFSRILFISCLLTLLAGCIQGAADPMVPGPGATPMVPGPAPTPMVPG